MTAVPAHGKASVICRTIQQAKERSHSGRLPHLTGNLGVDGVFDRDTGIESILGLRVNGEFLLIDPCIPTAWPGFEMTLRYRGAVYEISVRNPGKVSRGVVAAELDAASQAVSRGKVRLKLSEDRGTHAIVVTLGLVSLS
jgi:cellobiose phosphorylase